MELAPSVEGAIHLSELSWSRVGAPDEAVSLGDTVRAGYLHQQGQPKGHVRISLSRKQARRSWQDVATRLEAGAVVSGKVVRLAPFGAFVWKCCPALKALSTFSELSWTKRVAKAEGVLTAGDTVSVKVKEINLENRRISLSLRDAKATPGRAAQQFSVGTTVNGTVESRTPYGLFITLAPGITGLLPAGVIKNSSRASSTASWTRAMPSP